MSLDATPVSLVEVTTSDGLRLHGVLETPASSAPSPGNSRVDCWLCLHGTGSNFYAASTLKGLAPKLLAGGAAVLRANTRGHDLVCTGPSAGGRSLQGAAFERVDESPLDLTAWIEGLQSRGFQRIGLLGHSLGAIKAIFTLAAEQPPPVARLVAVSPPRLSYSYFLTTPRAEEFRAAFAQAEACVADGRSDELLWVTFPLPYYVTAAGYLDRYGPAERYNVLPLLERVACPTLVTYGTAESTGDAFRGMSEEVARRATPANRLSVAIVGGADHIYTGLHDVLAARISAWLAKD